ncbi:hypothetical protein RHSP_52212 [Rhizobium freirei PRF 81]|uniref:Uncharacterized protein n=1 Tax=Rhizobium freirei PRF 81 TaxID=363754 RepID=N6U9J3_9HYPH|nr:hypothetical protein RHSP_52212 [Rhizobium freirei PRF 81]
MSDVDHRVLQRLMQPLDFHAQLRTQLGIEVRQWLVEEEDIDIAHQGPADRDALALAARKFRRLAFQERLDLQDFGGPRDALVDLVLRHLGDAQAEGEVLLHRHLRIECVGLKHHADAAILGLFPGDILALDEDLSFADVEQTGNAVEQGRLAATRRSQEHQELAVIDLEIEVFQNIDCTEIQRKVFDGNAAVHGSPLHCAGCDAPDEKPSGHEIDDQRNKTRKDRCRHVDVVFLHTLDRIDDVIELDGHRIIFRPGEDDAEQEVVPDARDLQDHGDDEDRQRHGQHDAQENLPETRTVDARSLEKLHRQRREIIAEQQGQDRHTEDAVHQDKSAERAVDTDFAQYDDDRIDHHLIGDERADDQDREEEIRALEPPVGERVTIDRSNRDREDRGRHGDAYGIPETAG